MRTHFSFDVHYPAHSDSIQSGRDGVMGSLQDLLTGLLAAKDAAATVVVSDSHKGNGNKIVELTTTLRDEQIAEILQSFSGQHGVTVSALE
jgi:hypothetical protein